jgi:hypothetical protein
VNACTFQAEREKTMVATGAYLTSRQHPGTALIDSIGLGPYTSILIWEPRQTSRKGTEYNIVSHILNNGIIFNMSTPHMPLFKIGVRTFFEYAAILYSPRSAVIP